MYSFAQWGDIKMMKMIQTVAYIKLECWREELDPAFGVKVISVVVDPILESERHLQTDLPVQGHWGLLRDGSCQIDGMAQDYLNTNTTAISSILVWLYGLVVKIWLGIRSSLVRVLFDQVHVESMGKALYMHFLTHVRCKMSTQL